MQDKETGSVDSWQPLAASAAEALKQAQRLSHSVRQFSL